MDRLERGGITRRAGSKSSALSLLPSARVSSAGLHAGHAFAAAVRSLIAWVRILLARTLLGLHRTFVVFTGLLRAVDVRVVQSRGVFAHFRKILLRST